MAEEDTPFIDSPDELDDDPEKNGLACFINGDRICGADCMAFTTVPSESPYLNEQQKHCSLIVSAERLGRYAGGILSLFKKADADSKRSAPHVVDPKGGK
jgi:hypothetical protein